ncbi:MAG: hypothetical protein JNL39_06660 [Opitutaceae bacterium]|nr:hypothetical protein [Opitutaceae bacterium]
MSWLFAAIILAALVLVVYGCFSSQDRDRLPPPLALYWFGISAFLSLTFIAFWFLQPDSLLVAPLQAWMVYLGIRHGLRNTREHRVRASANYGSIKKTFTELAYDDAEVENILQNLPEGLQVSKRTKEIGFLRGGFRRFERIEIMGPSQTILLDCIDGRVAGKRISVRVPSRRS